MYINAVHIDQGALGHALADAAHRHPIRLGSSVTRRCKSAMHGLLQRLKRLRNRPRLHAPAIAAACTPRSIAIDNMKTTLLRARQMSLALLVIAVVDHGHLRADYAGATPNSSGLMRLGRDLMRRAGGGMTMGALEASEWVSSRNRRTRAFKLPSQPAMRWAPPAR
jgi:hypothetical protein